MLAPVGTISLLVLAVIVCAGGIAGYAKAKSKASLISGIVSAVLLASAFILGQSNVGVGLVFGAVVSALLCVVFGIRLKKTGKFMPAGMLLALCGLELLLLLASIFLK